MDSATIGTIANLATTVIIAVTAFAALRQMRHNQTANELQLFLHFVDEVQQWRESIDWTKLFRENMKDPEYRARVAEDSKNEDRQRFMKLMQFFERYASLVAVSGLSEHLMFFEYADMISMVWENCYEAVPTLRRGSTGYGGRAFENLAMRAKRYMGKRMRREYDRLERDPRLVAMEAERYAASDSTPR